MATAYFAPVFFIFCWGIFFPNQPESTLEFYERSIKVAAAAWQRGDSVGGWLHHRRSVAVRSDAWVMVMLLHLDCVQRNEWSRRTFRSLIFYIMCHFDRHYKENLIFKSAPKWLLHFLVFVRVQRVYVCTCYVPGITHTLRRYNDSGSMILAHIIVVLQIGATSYCCLLP